ncbi:hypothetical protein Pcinc_025793 [Petrolisthes cinctipes]|uniref:Uncharacterized protein n=1 Tax=Petrolisthes cinctipes TaxID=88211 RepID=A0AAE1F793_PETCI|nr:hypothetical protein Pcinc_025793 [Petrolisthes cinctipes]
MKDGQTELKNKKRDEQTERKKKRGEKGIGLVPSSRESIAVGGERGGRQGGPSRDGESSLCCSIPWRHRVEGKRKQSQENKALEERHQSSLTRSKRKERGNEIHT